MNAGAGAGGGPTRPPRSQLRAPAGVLLLPMPMGGIPCVFPSVEREREVQRHSSGGRFRSLADVSVGSLRDPLGITVLRISHLLA
jgi:hypothetical protein